MKLRWSSYPFKEAFVHSDVLSLALRVLPKLWNLHCGRIPREKIDMGPVNRAGHGRLGESLPGGSVSWCPEVLPAQILGRAPQGAAGLTLEAEDSWERNPRSSCKRVTKGHCCGSLWIWKLPDQFSLHPEENGA